MSFSLFCLIFIFFTDEVIAYHSGTVVGEFYKTLINRNESQFWDVFYKASLIYLGQTLVGCLIKSSKQQFLQVKALCSLSSWLLAVALRRNLVTGLHNIYFQRHTYYKINTIHRESIDNP